MDRNFPSVGRSGADFVGFLRYAHLVHGKLSAHPRTGGLSTNLGLLKANIALSIVVALVGILVPIGLSLISFVYIFQLTPLQGFTAGAAMCSTSLGTTMAILASLNTNVDLRNTRIGTVLLSAAMIDDVVGLIMASVVGQVSGPGRRSGSLAWTILRPVVASFGVSFITPIVTHWCFTPVHLMGHRRFGGVGRRARAVLLVILVAVLSSLIAVCNYAGTSMLFGAYVAGCMLAHLDVSMSLRLDTVDVLTFHQTFEDLIAPSNDRILVPLFFASIGAAIPFVPLFKPAVLWKGILYSGLMFIAKATTGLCILLWGRSPTYKRQKHNLKEANASGGKQVSAEKPSVEVLVPVTTVTTLPIHQLEDSNSAVSRSWPILPAILIALAMIARGEIALIIAQIGRTALGEDGFLVVIWAVVLCTLLGPLLTGVLVRKHADKLGRGIWGEPPRVKRMNICVS